VTDIVAELNGLLRLPSTGHGLASTLQRARDEIAMLRACGDLEAVERKARAEALEEAARACDDTYETTGRYGRFCAAAIRALNVPER
jgi:hypothetical protein